MLLLDNYWHKLALNDCPTDILSWYKTNVVCTSLLINTKGDWIMVHFRFTVHVWHKTTDGKWTRGPVSNFLPEKVRQNAA